MIAYLFMLSQLLLRLAQVAVNRCVPTVAAYALMHSTSARTVEQYWMHKAISMCELEPQCSCRWTLVFVLQ